MNRNERKPALGKVAFADLFEDMKLCPYVVTAGKGSKTIAPAGYVFMSIKYPSNPNYRCDFQRVIEGKTFMLYVKPSQLLRDTFARVEIDGLASIEIITNAAWDREGGAIVIAGDKSFISREWIGLVDPAELPDLEKIEIYAP
jgi:hypothetical protein